MKKVLSFFLAILMVLAVVPVSVLPVFASDAKGEASAQANGSADWDDMSATEKTEAYKSLYVGGASVILMAYDAEGGQVTLNADGSGSWKNLVDGNTVSLTKSAGAANGGYGTYSRYTFGHGAVLSPEADGKYFAEYRVGAITYDGDTPLYMAITEWYVAKEQTGSLSNNNCKPVKINDKTGFLSHQDYYTYKWVAEEGTTTYVKIQNYWEKASTGFAEDGSKAFAMSDTAIDGATQRTRVVEWTTEAPADLTGWTVLEGGKFVNDALKDFFGGWKLGANGGVRVTLTDANLVSNSGISSIKLDQSYIPAVDSEYTVEIIASTTPSVDTDNNMNTFGVNFSYEGEVNRPTVFEMGSRLHQWGIGSNLYANASVFMTTNYNFLYTIDGKNNQVNIGAKLASDANGKIATITYSKTADTVGYDYDFSYRYYNGSKMTEYAYKAQNDCAVAEKEKTNFVLMQNASNTTYAVRVYNTALTAAEKNRNHFVDLCAYFGVDVSRLLALQKDLRDMVLNMLGADFTDKTFENTSKVAIEAAINGLDWAELEVLGKTYSYKSLYVDGASVVLMAYDLVGGQVTLNADGSGTWKNLVDGNTVSLTKFDGARDNGYGTYSRNTFGHGSSLLPDYYEGYQVGAIAYDGATPLYMAITKWYVAETNGDYEKTNTYCKPVVINNTMRYLSHQDYYTYKWVAEEGTTTYVMIQNYWEKKAVNGVDTTGATSYKLSDTAFDGATQRTRVVEWTTERPADLTGWTVLEGGKFVADALKDFFGGWKAGANGGIQIAMSDANLSSRSGNSAIELDSRYIPALDSEYTIEIIASTNPAIDTDNNMNTFGANFNYEGAMNRQTAITIGSRLHQWAIADGALANASVFASVGYHYVVSRYSHKAYGSSNINGKIATITYSKTADTEGYDYAFNYRFYDGSAMKEYGVVSHDNSAAETKSDVFKLMQNASNTTYAVRVYNKVLTEAEKNRNHFVDLCAYYGVDISILMALEETEREAFLAVLIPMFANETFETTSQKKLYTEIYNLATREQREAQLEQYRSLYAKDATVLLMAYDTLVSGITIESGKGTWKNLMDDNTVTLNGGLGGAKAAVTERPVDTWTDQTEIGYTALKVQFDENGAPLWAGKTEYYVKPDCTNYTSNNNCRPMQIEGYKNGTQQYLQKTVATLYKWVPDETRTTYIKSFTVYEKTGGAFSANAGNVKPNYMQVSYSSFSGATAFTHYTFTETKPDDMTGFTAYKGYFVEDTLSDFFGGWRMEEQGIRNNMTDIAIYTKQADVSINLKEYLSALNNAYTVEIIAQTFVAVDTDGSLNTHGHNFNHQGEANRITVMQIGNRSHQWCVGSGAYVTDGTVFMDANYNTISGSQYKPANYKVTDINGKIATITYSKTADTVGYDYAFSYRFYNGSSMYDYAYTSHDNFEGETAGTSFALMQNAPNQTYAVRVYARALTDAEKAQNHFVDLLAYYGVDASALVALSDAARETAFRTLGAKYNSLSFENVTAEMLASDLDAAVKAAEVIEQTTKKLASLYAPGATGIFMAYSAKTDGTVMLDGNGGGTWINLAGESNATLVGSVKEFTGKDGKEYSTGWHISDHSIGYDLSWQQRDTLHEMTISSELLGNGDNTTELVVFMDGMLIDTSSEPPLNADNSPEKWGNLMMGKNYQMYFKHNKKYTGAETLLPATSINAGYSDNGAAWAWNAGSKGNVLTNYNNVPVRFIVTEDVLGDGNITIGWKLYTSGSKTVAENFATTAYISQYGATTHIFNQTPMEVYAVRTYKRVLDEAEKMQNHFVDLCAYAGVDVSKLVDADETVRATALAALSKTFADRTFSTANKDEIETAIDAGIDEAKATIEARKKTELYASLYVDGASVVLMAYDLVGGQVTLNADGSGTWKNLVDGKSVSLTNITSGAANGGYGTYSRYTFGHGSSGLPDNYAGYRTGAITYDGDTPLYMAITEWYVAETNGDYAIGNSTCKPVVLNGKNLYLSHQDYYTYKWVAEEGTTTYVKVENYWEMKASSFDATFVNSYKLSDTAIDGAIQKTRVVDWTTEAPADLTGWTVLEGGKFVQDALKDFFGGWKAGANGGVQMKLSDANLSSKYGNASIDLGANYLPAIDSEYTIEIITKATLATDTDNNGNTFGANFSYDGEPNRLQAFYIGNQTHFWCVSTTAFNSTAMSNSNYFSQTNIIGTNTDGNQGGFNAAAVANNKIWTLTYNKVANGTLENGGTTYDAFQYSYDIKYYNGSAYTQQANTYYAQAAETAQGTKGFVLLQNVPNTTYAVRVYNKALTEAEKNQNHFVDLLLYTGAEIDVDAYVALSAEQKAYLHGKLANVALESPDAKLLTEYYCEIANLTEVNAAENIFESVSVQAKIIENGASGNNFLRTLYSIDVNLLSELAEKYSIRVGALVGVGSYKNQAVNDLLTLCVDSEGKPVNKNASSVVVWADENDMGATFTFVSYDKVTGKASFAYSVDMGDLDRTGEDLIYRYNTELLFRGFAIFEDRETGEVITLYYNPSESFREGANMVDVAERLLDYVDEEANRLFFDNDNFKAISENGYVTLDYYVDMQGGDDANDGSSTLSAKKTIAAAYAAGAAAADAKAATSINIHLAMGTSTLAATESLDGTLLDGKNCRVRILGDEHGSTLTSNYEFSVPEFDHYQDGIYTFKLPDGVDGDFRQLYVNGEMAELAHTDWFTSKYNEVQASDGTWLIPVDIECLGDLITIAAFGGMPTTKNLDETLEWFGILNFYYIGVRIVGIDWAKTKTTKIDGKYCVYLQVKAGDETTRTDIDGGVEKPRGLKLSQGKPFRLENNLAFLDEVGEYFYDEAARTIYYKPESAEAMENATFGVPMCDKLLSLTDIENVSIEGVTFTGVDSTFMNDHGYKSGQAGAIRATKTNSDPWVSDAAVYMHNVKNVKVDDCVFTETHSHAIFADGDVRGLTVTDNDFTGIGGSAMLIATTSYDSILHNNYMKNIAMKYVNCCAVTFKHAADLRILKNSIINCAYTGISVGYTWSWNELPYGESVNLLRVETAYNYIENYMCYTFDGGAVYYNGGAAPQSYDVLFNSVHDNYAIVNSREGFKTTNATSSCWYMDGSTSHTYVYNNAVYADITSRTVWSYISLQGAGNETAGDLNYTDEQWDAYDRNDRGQVYRISCESNYFINVWESYKTTGSGRVRAIFNLFETNSYIFASDDVERAANNGELPEGYAEATAGFTAVDKQSEIAAIVNGAGCTDRGEGTLSRPDVPDLSGYRQQKVENFESDSSANSGQYQSQENKYNVIPEKFS